MRGHCGVQIRRTGPPAQESRRRRTGPRDAGRRAFRHAADAGNRLGAPGPRRPLSRSGRRLLDPARYAWALGGPPGRCPGDGANAGQNSGRLLRQPARRHRAFRPMPDPRLPGHGRGYAGPSGHAAQPEYASVLRLFRGAHGVRPARKRIDRAGPLAGTGRNRAAHPRSARSRPRRPPGAS